MLGYRRGFNFQERGFAKRVNRERARRGVSLAEKSLLEGTALEAELFLG